jgi:hypothetical protein
VRFASTGFNAAHQLQSFSSGERNRDSLGDYAITHGRRHLSWNRIQCYSSEQPGVAVGKSAPTFHARDQSGKEQTISSLMGRNGLVLVFFRSADW